MKPKTLLLYINFFFILTFQGYRSLAHDIYFCGEKIPLDDKFVADKLMSIIKRQINYVNLPSLRDSISKYMPRVEAFLQQYNLPQDFKYLAIVESGFKTDVESKAGAKGFWQLMPGTAKDWDLIVDIARAIDDRTDFEKSTRAACREIARNYKYIQTTCGVTSWVLTAAAYNHGMGNIKNAINKQGKDYFSMDLNPETAAYVYKIIAIKELFEFPELYMQNFGYNIFSKAIVTNPKGDAAGKDLSLGRMKVNVDLADGSHPQDLQQKYALKSTRGSTEKVVLVNAKVTGKYKDLKDGDLITFMLENDLTVGTTFTAKGTPIQGWAWIIGDRVMIDMGHQHKIILFDTNNEKGIKLSKLKKKKPEVILQVTTSR